MGLYRIVSADAFAENKLAAAWEFAKPWEICSERVNFTDKGRGNKCDRCSRGHYLRFKRFEVSLCLSYPRRH